MPLRDHFLSTLDDVHSWDELHGDWPMMIVREFVEVLPEPYFAAPGVHSGRVYEVDVGTRKTGQTHKCKRDVAFVASLDLDKMAPEGGFGQLKQAKSAVRRAELYRSRYPTCKYWRATVTGCNQVT